jgi:hypothetical protein
MHHPDLLAALALDRVRQCPCGAMADRAHGFCRKCQARGAWRGKTASKRRQAARRVRNFARLLVGAMPLLLTFSKEKEG